MDWFLVSKWKLWESMGDTNQESSMTNIESINAHKLGKYSFSKYHNIYVVWIRQNQKMSSQPQHLWESFYSFIYYVGFHIHQLIPKTSFSPLVLLWILVEYHLIIIAHLTSHLLPFDHSYINQVFWIFFLSLCKNLT